MTKKSPFLLVSLNESQTKELAQVIANDTCRKILNFLAEKEFATESDIAEGLRIPISTVHYNLQQLVKGNLVTIEEFHYSEKGREVNHYQLANKYIIIAPKNVSGIREKLRSILPVVGIVGGLAIVMEFLNRFGRMTASSSLKSSASMMQPATPLMQEAVQNAPQVEQMVADRMMASVPNAGGAIEKAMQPVQDAAASVMSNESTYRAIDVLSPETSQSMYHLIDSQTFWFILGACIALGLFLLIERWRNR